MNFNLKIQVRSSRRNIYLQLFKFFVFDSVSRSNLPPKFFQVSKTIVKLDHEEKWQTIWLTKHHERIWNSFRSLEMNELFILFSSILLELYHNVDDGFGTRNTLNNINNYDPNLGPILNKIILFTNYFIIQVITKIKRRMKFWHSTKSWFQELSSSDSKWFRTINSWKDSIGWWSCIEKEWSYNPEFNKDMKVTHTHFNIHNNSVQLFSNSTICSWWNNSWNWCSNRSIQEWIEWFMYGCDWGSEY